MVHSKRLSKSALLCETQKRHRDIGSKSRVRDPQLLSTGSQIRFLAWRDKRLPTCKICHWEPMCTDAFDSETMYTDKHFPLLMGAVPVWRGHVTLEQRSTFGEPIHNTRINCTFGNCESCVPSIEQDTAAPNNTNHNNGPPPSEKRMTPGNDSPNARQKRHAEQPKSLVRHRLTLERCIHNRTYVGCIRKNETINGCNKRFIESREQWRRSRSDKNPHSKRNHDEHKDLERYLPGTRRTEGRLDRAEDGSTQQFQPGDKHGMSIQILTPGPWCVQG